MWLAEAVFGVQIRLSQEPQTLVDSVARRAAVEALIKRDLADETSQLLRTKANERQY